MQGLRNSSCTVAVSATSPAYITEARSQISATSPRSWVMNSTEEMIVFFSVLISSTICAWMVTSRLEVGSSAMSSTGWQARAMAMTMRCCIPPDSSWG